ncbi:MAG: hypothetical protein GY865_18695 [candidate division Zixibacteria bacterium]|nr:hypothetical protein [candidate division Zixibacteria bacterium]
MGRIILTLTVFFLFTANLFAFTPPKKLNWGMTYKEAKKHLGKELPKDQRLKLGKLKDVKGMAGYKSAELKKSKILKKKTYFTALYFDDTGKLGSFLYMFMWENSEDTRKAEEGFSGYAGKGREECWAFQQNLVQKLTSKNGEPVVDETIDKRGEIIASKTQYKVQWVDADTGDEINLILSRSMHKDFVFGETDRYVLYLSYANEKMIKATEAAEEASDAESDDL